MAEDKNNINWIVTPGLRPVVRQLVKLYDDFYSTKAKIIINKPLMIIGDTGVGKSLFLEIFKHKYETDYKCNVIKINIAAFSKNLIESELFGHVQGAFTGATKKREGFIKKADGGLLVIEEIGELSKELQSKLLTFIEDGYFYPVGSEKVESADVQIVTTTNKQKKRFRDDFWQRFFHFYIPAIFERRGDILYYLYHYHKDVILSLSQNEILFLLTYNWPGNVREIENFGILLKLHEPLRLSLKPPQERRFSHVVFMPGSKIVSFNDGVFNRLLYYTFLEQIGFDAGEIEIFYTFLKKIDFDLSVDHYAFSDNFEIEINSAKELKVNFYSPSDIFDKYNNSLEMFNRMFYLPDNLNENLLEVDTIDSIDWFYVDWECYKLYDYTWTEEEKFFRRKILEFRVAKAQGKSPQTQKDCDSLGLNLVKIDISSITDAELEELRIKVYNKRLEQSGGNKSKAARSLGIPESTFKNRLKK